MWIMFVIYTFLLTGGTKKEYYSSTFTSQAACEQQADRIEKKYNHKYLKTTASCVRK